MPPALAPAASTPSPQSQSHPINPPSYSYSYSIRPATLADLPHLPAIEKSAAELFSTIPGFESLGDDEPTSAETHREKLGLWEAVGVGVGRGGIWVAVARSEHTDGAMDDAAQEEVVGFVLTELLPVVGGVSSGAGEGAGQPQSTAITVVEDENRSKPIDSHADLKATAEAFFIHVDELSVSAEHQRRGLASGLLNTVRDFAELHRSSFARSRGRFCKATQDRIANDEAVDRKDVIPILGLSLTTFLDLPFNAPFYAKCGFRVLDTENDGEVERVVGREGSRIVTEDLERLRGLGRRCFMVCEL